MPDNLIPEEQELADALRLITAKYGKFNDDNTGVWAGYTRTADNLENAKIGVKCGNCVFFNAPNGCEIIASEVEEGGLCRFAVLPDGTVKASGGAGAPSEVLDMDKIEKPKTEPHLSIQATAGSKPAPKKDQIKGSKKNAPGSADTGKSVKFTDSIITALEKKVKDHNEKAPNGRKVTLAKLKAVYRRGAGAFSTSHRPDQTRNSWAMARVNAFLKLVRSGRPTNPKYVTDNDLLPKMHPRSTASIQFSSTLQAIIAAANDDSCPPATQDIVLNIENRQNAIDNVGYGPLNPKDEKGSAPFWKEKADRWGVSPDQAKKSICGNCVFFIKTPKMLECIATGIEQGGSGEQNAWDAIDQAELGYCEALDFKCAASRTCNAWAVGGPITEEK
jgi:hypothetical protein